MPNLPLIFCKGRKHTNAFNLCHICTYLFTALQWADWIYNFSFEIKNLLDSVRKSLANNTHMAEPQCMKFLEISKLNINK